MFPLGPAAVRSAVPLLGIWLLLGYLGSSSKQMPRADQTAWNLGVFLLYLCGLWCDQEYFSGWFQVSVAYLGQERSINSTVYTGKLCLQTPVACQISISWMYSFPECCAVPFSVPKKCQKAREHFGTVRTQMESLKTKFPADQYYRCAGSHTARHRYVWELLGHLASLLWNNDVKVYGLNASFSLKSKSR